MKIAVISIQVFGPEGESIEGGGFAPTIIGVANPDDAPSYALDYYMGTIWYDESNHTYPSARDVDYTVLVVEGPLWGLVQFDTQYGAKKFAWDIYDVFEHKE